LYGHARTRTLHIPTRASARADTHTRASTHARAEIVGKGNDIECPAAAAGRVSDWERAKIGSSVAFQVCVVRQVCVVLGRACVNGNHKTRKAGMVDSTYFSQWKIGTRCTLTCAHAACCLAGSPTEYPSTLSCERSRSVLESAGAVFTCSVAPAGMPDVQRCTVRARMGVRVHVRCACMMHNEPACPIGVRTEVACVPVRGRAGQGGQ
jgi:hypothetical protein